MLNHYKFKPDHVQTGPAGRLFLFPPSSHDVGHFINPGLKPLHGRVVDILGEIDATQGERRT